MRLKIEYTGGYETVNRLKFNEQYFAGQLANPGTSLHFYLRKCDTKLFNKK